MAVTMGCPAGIGPEVVLQALSGPCRDAACIIVGDIAILERAAALLGIDIEFGSWRPGMVAGPYSSQGGLYVYEATRLRPGDVPFGKVSELTGRASYTYVQKALDLVFDGEVAAMATAPISKEGLRLAGVDFPGHTEILADRCGTDRFVMMMAGQRLKVSLATIHLPLRDVPLRLSREGVLETISITWQALVRDFAMPSSKLAVAGLNPHAGEGGMFGHEEEEIIMPAIRRARELGMDVHGPFPPDTVFWHAVQGRFQAVVAMYHDQGLIPFKLLHFSDGVNVTLGLPIVRTSVDHGTAYDIAGKGLADPASMAAAIRLAGTIWRNRQTA